jgi:hypothetical protein
MGLLTLTKFCYIQGHLSMQDSAAAYTLTYLNLRNGRARSVACYNLGADYTENTAYNSTFIVGGPMPSNWRLVVSRPFPTTVLYATICSKGPYFCGRSTVSKCVHVEESSIYGRHFISNISVSGSFSKSNSSIFTATNSQKYFLSSEYFENWETVLLDMFWV